MKSTPFTSGFAVVIALLLGYGGPSSVLLAQSLSCSPMQVSNTSTGSGNWVSLNDDGTRLALQAENGVFLHDTTTATLAQIASSGSQPSISADGTRIAFVSSANLTGAAKSQASTLRAVLSVLVLPEPLGFRRRGCAVCGEELFKHKPNSYYGFLEHGYRRG